MKEQEVAKYWDRNFNVTASTGAGQSLNVNGRNVADLDSRSAENIKLFVVDSERVFAFSDESAIRDWFDQNKTVHQAHEIQEKKAEAIRTFFERMGQLQREKVLSD